MIFSNTDSEHRIQQIGTAGIRIKDAIPLLVLEGIGKSFRCHIFHNQKGKKFNSEYQTFFRTSQCLTEERLPGPYSLRVSGAVQTPIEQLSNLLGTNTVIGQLCLPLIDMKKMDI